MSKITEITPIAYIHNDFKEKFGIPRQSGRVPQIISRIVFEPEYRNSDALRGLDGFSHLWILWQFSESGSDRWSPTVRPPRLGGNQRMEVFATRSPFRPNPIGLSCVEIRNIALSSPEGPYIEVSGADLMDGTPIYDIKPYLPYVDSVPEALGGFAEEHKNHFLQVKIPIELKEKLTENQIQNITELLSLDPRPSYQNDEERIYGLSFEDLQIKFKYKEDKIIVSDIIRG